MIIQHNSDITTLNEEHKGTTLSAYVRSLIRDSIPYSIKWDVIKRAAPYNPITKICRLCISEKVHILFHPEDATLNQRSEFFSKCWHKDCHLLVNNQKAFLKNFSILSLSSKFTKLARAIAKYGYSTISFLCNIFQFCIPMYLYLCNLFNSFSNEQTFQAMQFKTSS